MDYDYLIIGAGPAGLQLAYNLEKAGCNFLILEKGPTAGTFYTQYPRHRKLISINKVYTGCSDPEKNMRWDWNSLVTKTEPSTRQLKDYTKEYFPKADHLVSYLQNFAENHVSHIRYNTEVTKVFRNRQRFHVHSATGEIFTGARLICATGVYKPYIPPINGIGLVEQYDEMSVDPEDFINQRVLIIGKGNSAFETADNLISHAATIHLVGPSLLKFAWKTHFVGHLRAVNNNILDTYQLKAQNGILDATVEHIQKVGDGFKVLVTHHRANNTQVTYHYDRILCCTGFRFDTSIFDESCQPELDSNIKNRFPKQTETWQSVNVPDLYFIGTLMQQRDYRKSSSGFIHGFRHNIESFFNMLLLKYEKKPWPCQPLEESGLAAKMIEEVNRSASLMLQFGFLSDLYVLSDLDKTAQYYQSIPVDYVHKSALVHDKAYFVVTLEYGNKEFDPFYDERVSEHDPDNAEESTAIHPVVRYFKQGECIAEHHIIENLEAEWNDIDLHIRPLEQFLLFFRHNMSSFDVLDHSIGI